MSSRHNDICPYCDTEFVVEFYTEDCELMHCPACGEELPQFDSDEDFINEYVSNEFEDY